MRNSPFAFVVLLGLTSSCLLAGCASVGSPLAPPIAAEATTPTASPDGRLAFPDAVTLRNAQVELAVSPGVGRIVRFGRVGGENLLWVATPDAYAHPYVAGGRSYVNLGGDKVWPTVQALWARAYGGAGNWPPEHALDGAPWALLEHTPRRVVIESGVSPALGVSIRRTISLAEEGARVDIVNTIRRVEANPFPLHVWSVTQTVSPEFVLLDIAADRPTSKRWELFDSPEPVASAVAAIADGRAAAWRLDPGLAGDDGKVGTLGRWVAGVYADTLFVQSARFDPRGAYPDASSVQVYRNNDYTELELLGPFTHLQPGETLTHRVTWHLLDRPAGSRSDAEAVRAAVVEAIDQSSVASRKPVVPSRTRRISRPLFPFRGE